ncbi:hypothetical protein [Natrinema amylolyticum]|uniref:hypothetical protein n=1 Tax=Natrinema amylolyticum TaxID=2878679 RepID=UPI001CFA05EA|nr:hypothetical protein [Natrinema amylolyticum]
MALLGGCSAADDTSDEPAADDPSGNGNVTLDSILLHNRYEKDAEETPAEETDSADRGVGIALLVEFDGTPVQWSEHVLDHEEEYLVRNNWPSKAGQWTIHARKVATGKISVATEWPSIDLADYVRGDDPTSVAVDVIVKDTGRIALDATPTT